MKGFPTPAHTHNIIQASFAAFYVYVGFKFYLFYLWAIEASSVFVSRPASVEAFLPISAVLGLKNWLFSGEWDMVHPAGLCITLLALALAVFARKAFCGYLCPVGFALRMVDKIGRRLGITRRPHRYVIWLLSVPKYILLASSLWLIVINMPLDAVRQFMVSPYNIISDAKMLEFFLSPSRNTLIGVGVIIIGTMLFPGFWCRGFCPYGALMGLLAVLSPFAVKRDNTKCTHCRRCTKACPVQVQVHQLGRISGPECHGCLECVSVCPEEGCLSLHVGYRKTRSLKPWVLPALCLFAVFFMYSAAVSLGLWDGEYQMQYREFYKHLKSFGH